MPASARIPSSDHWRRFDAILNASRHWRDDAPGWRDDAPGWRDDAPGWRDDAPGWRDDAPGWRDDAPGWHGDAPGMTGGNGDASVHAVSPKTLVAVDLACRRGDRLLFEGLGFRVDPGGALTLEGPNGSGKSSLLRLLAGLLVPAAGRIDGGGARGFLGHDAALKPRQRLGDELAFWARIDGVADRLLAAIAAVNLAGLVDVPCRHLSSGQRRRAGLARVIAGGAPLWLLDEPTAGLDAASCDLLAHAMAAHRASGGMIVAAVHGDIGLGEHQTLRLG